MECKVTVYSFHECINYEYLKTCKIDPDTKELLLPYHRLEDMPEEFGYKGNYHISATKVAEDVVKYNISNPGEPPLWLNFDGLTSSNGQFSLKEFTDQGTASRSDDSFDEDSEVAEEHSFIATK